ncbi:MAG: LacI family DNA-binding transcriptional regulator [Christensenella sp.]
MKTKKKANGKLKKSTMVDVAKRASVTIGTVSHVINKTAPITKETTDRVLKAIKALNYKPNSIAQALRTRKSYVIGFLLPDVTNEFYSPVMSSFIDCAYKDGYSVLVVSYQYSSRREVIEMDRLADKNVDGILLFNGCDDIALLERMEKEGMPIVLADRRVDEVDFPSVEFNNVETVGKVVDMLYKKGYRKIGFLSESARLRNLNDRYNGYKEGMTRNGLEIDPAFVYISEDMEMNNLVRGYTYIKSIFETTDKKDLPDAIFATTDLLAIGAVRALKEAGFRVPQDVGVVGFDNIAITDFVEPKLTTVEQDKELMGREAWTLMKALVDEKNIDVPHKILPQKIIKRKSC